MPITDSNPRPQLLTWLCAGSFVVGSLWLIMLVSLFVFNQAGMVSTRLFPGIAIEYLNSGYIFIIAEILLTVSGIFAVGLMWRMRKTGFYLYAVIKTIIYFLPVIFIGNNHLTFLNLIITSILIIMYGTIFTGRPEPTNR